MTQLQSWAKDLAGRVDHVDVCVNNAGVVGSNGYQKWDLDDMDAEEMMFCFKANTVRRVASAFPRSST